MDRRQFFKTGAKAAAAGAAISLPVNAIQAADSPAAKTCRRRIQDAGDSRQLHGGGPPAAAAERRHLHAEDPQVHAQAPDYRLSPRSMRLQHGRVSQPQAVGARRIRRAGIGPVEGPRNPVDPRDGRMERSLWNVRRQQVDRGQSAGISPFRDDGPQSRHEDSCLCIERIFCRAAIRITARNGRGPGMRSAAGGI